MSFAALDSYIGEIRLFVGKRPPSGWAFCTGQTLPIAQNQALFAVIGNQYGGDGRTNFQLPNISPVKENDGGTAPIQYMISLSGLWPASDD
jgi:microcystin-dependent protein